MVVNRFAPFMDGPAGPDTPAEILVVEDDREIAEYLGRRALDYFDCPVLLASSLFEANAALDDHTPTVAIVDLLLPDGEATDLLLRLERDQVAAVSVITAAADSRRATLALRSGAADFLAKPFTDEQLNGMFERLHRRLAARDEAARLAKHADSVEQANQQLRLQINILCKDLVGGYQKLVARLTKAG